MEGEGRSSGGSEEGAREGEGPGKRERGVRRPLAFQRSGLRRRFDLLSL